MINFIYETDKAGIMNNLSIAEVLGLLEEKNKIKAPDNEERKNELSDFFCRLSYELDYLLNDEDISCDEELDIISVQHIVMNIAVSDYLLRHHDGEYCQEALLSKRHYIEGQRILLEEFNCDPMNFTPNFSYSHNGVIIGPFKYTDEEFNLGRNYLLIACTYHDDQIDHIVNEPSHLNHDNNPSD